MAHFRLKANINTKTIKMSMYVGDFTLKVQANVN